MKISTIAKICHEVNKAYCEALGDHSQKPWNFAEQWQRDSCINGVEFTLANPDCTSSDQHEQWVKVKVEDGWVYGEEKNVDKKTHPCLLPYEELPKEHQIKDVLFRAVVRATQGE